MASDVQQRTIASGAVINPSSAPVAEDMTPEARKALYEKLRERMRKSPLQVTAPSGITPYWARRDDMTEMSRLDMLGFRVVHDDPKKPRFTANGLKADGTYQLGDVILMEIETQIYEFYFQETQERARMLVEGIRPAFKEEAGRLAVPTFDVNKAKGE